MTEFEHIYIQTLIQGLNNLFTCGESSLEADIGQCATAVWYLSALKGS